MQKYKIDEKLLLEDEKTEIIEHLNKDHIEDLILVAKTFGGLKDVETCQLLDIYQDSCSLEVTLSSGEQKNIEVEFTAKGDITEKMLFLAYEAMLKNKELLMTTKGGKTQYFEFIQKEKVTKNIVRLHLKSFESLSENYAGLAYNFKLQNLQTIPAEEKAKKTKNKMSFFQHKFMSILLFISKKLSSSRRRTILKKMARGRYYTVRRISKSEKNQQNYDLTQVDVLLHGNSPGTIWAKSCKKGDILVSLREHPEKFLTLEEEGKILLIADETAYPAVAGFLENWKFNQAPLVFLTANSAAEKSYFNDCKFPENTQFEWIVCNYDEQLQKILAKIDEVSQSGISLVWGALEANIAKKIRVFLRAQLAMDNKKTILKGYWTKE